MKCGFLRWLLRRNELHVPNYPPVYIVNICTTLPIVMTVRLYIHSRDNGTNKPVFCHLIVNHWSWNDSWFVGAEAWTLTNPMRMYWLDGNLKRGSRDVDQCYDKPAILTPRPPVSCRLHSHAPSTGSKRWLLSISHVELHAATFGI
jgi:hypothetical protein